MKIFPPIIWLLLAILFLIPTPVGRVVIDLASGVLFLIFAIPLVIAGISWIGLKVIESKMITCKVCGINILSSSSQCPSCGAIISNVQITEDGVTVAGDSRPASTSTVDITAENIDD